MAIDAHHHFWHYDPVEYDWIDEPLQRIRRDFLPADLKAAIAETNVEGVISVQARQSLVETEWLLHLADQNPFIWGVVGWVPLLDEELLAGELERLSENPWLRGVRHVVQGEADDFLLREDFNRGVAQLRGRELTYDILIFERQLAAAIEFVDRHPQQVFVLDHIAKPRIGENVLEPWRTQIKQLAQRENVYCKFSGLVTETDYNAWTADQLLPYWDAVLDAFGPQRLMFGSDWPVCLVATEYAAWFRLVEQFAQPLSPDERQWLFARTAAAAYHLSD